MRKNKRKIEHTIKLTFSQPHIQKIWEELDRINTEFDNKPMLLLDSKQWNRLRKTYKKTSRFEH